MTALASPRLQRLLGFLAEDPENLPLLEDAADAALEAGDTAKAQEFATRYRTLAAPSPSLANLEGLVAMSEGRFQDAATLLEPVLSAAPETPAIRFNLAWCQAVLGDWPRVAELVDETVVAETPRAAALKVQALHHLGDLEGALAWGQGAAERYPEDTALQGALAIAALDAEELDLAASFAGRTPDTAQGQAVRGMLLLNADEPERALAVFEQALMGAPEDGRALLGKGLSLLAKGDYPAAASDIDRSAHAFGDHVGSWVAAGWAYFSAGDHATSRQRFETALSLDENFAEVHGGLAVLDVIGGRIEEARRRTELALRLDRTCFAGALARVLLLTHDGDTATAQRLQAIALSAPAGPGGRTIAQAMASVGRRARP